MIWQEDVFNILLATFLGAAIGLERELSGKSAGLRTNLLICLGAAIFTIISKRMVVGEGSTTRVAAQIVTGVGFLGAGALIQDRRGVHGLTTAATIWLVASIGMACGAGFPFKRVFPKSNRCFHQSVKTGRSLPPRQRAPVQGE